MAVQLYGNVNGTYQKQYIDLFEAAKKQQNPQMQFCNAQVGENAPAIKVSISDEGLSALRGSRLRGSADLEKTLEEIQFISEHQPVEGFTNRFSRVVKNSYVQLADEHADKELSIQRKADLLLGEFKSICDEIVSGHEEGSRIRFIEDSAAKYGYKELTKDDELAILFDEFREFVEKRFGRQHQEESVRAAEIVNEFQKVKQELGRGTILIYEPEYIPEDFAERLLSAASEYMKA